MQQHRASPSIRDLTSAELDALIARAEFDVATRDARVAARTRTLGQLAGARARQALRVGGLGLGALAVGALLFRRPLWSMRRELRQHLPRRRHRRRDGDDGSPPRSLALLTTMLPLMWPYMPVALRSRVSARTASMVAGIALPFLFGGRRRATRD